jgi:hypothetical protein
MVTDYRRTRLARAIAVTVFSASLMAQTAPRATTAAGAWIQVDVSSGRTHLQSLGAADAIEQLRDWALFAAYSLSAPSGASHREPLVSLLPVRIDALSSLYFRRVGEARAIALSDGRFVVLVPEASTGPRRQLQVGRLLDEERATKGRIPPAVLLFEYRVQDDPGGVSLRAAGETPGQAYFRESEGYYERTIATLGELDLFLALNLDLTYSRLDRGRLVVGGRRIEEGLPRLITREDLAALAQGEVGIEDEVRGRLRRRGLRAEYDRAVRQRATEALAARDTTGIAPYAEMLELVEQVQARNPYSAYEADMIERVMDENPPSLGFSLDPRENTAAIAADLDRALRGDPQLFDGWYLGVVATQIAQTRALEGDDSVLEELLSKMRAMRNSAGGTAESTIRTLIGLDVPPPAPSRDAGTAATPTLTRHDDDTREVAATFLQETKAVIEDRAEELRRVVSGLRRGSDGALLDLQRYLNAEAIGLTMRPGAAAYRVRDLQQMLHDTVDESLAVDGVYGAKTTTTVKAFQERTELKQTGVVDEETWKALLATNEEVADGLDRLRLFLNDIESKNNFQCARYDGQLAGTPVGMTFFYTDLLMKLWTFADRDATPPVPGFTSYTQFEVSPVYWERERRFSSTRSWLGPLEEAYKVHSGNILTFAPVMTRLYNASSNPLVSGKEVPAKFGAQRFSDWWNAHYLEVADYEPQYHRLNQIMKWIVALNAYDDANLPMVASLRSSPVTRNLRLDTWWASNRANLRVPPVDSFRRVDGEPTECLDILQSKPYYALGSTYQMSGGVSGAGKASVRAKKLVNEARSDVPEVLKFARADVAKAQVDNRMLRVPLTEGGVERGRLELGRGAPTAEFVPDSQRPLEGMSGRVLVDRMRFEYETMPDAGARVRASAGSEPMFDVAMKKAPDGSGIVLEYADGEMLQAVRELKQANGLQALDPQSHVWIPDTKQILVRGAQNRWMVVTPLKTAGKAAAAEPELHFALGNETLVIRRMSGGDLTKITAPLQVERVRALSFGGDAPLVSELVRDVPASAVDIRVRVGATELRATLDDGLNLYLPRSAAEPGEGAGLLGRSLSGRDLATLLRKLDGEGAGAVAAMRGKDSQLVVVSTGGGATPQQMSVLAEILPSDAKGRQVFIRAGGEAGVRLDERGVLELPKAFSQLDGAVAARTIRAMGDDPSIASAFARLGTLDAATVDTVVKIPAFQRATYLEFRAAPALLPREVLVDTRVVADSTTVVVRRGGDVELMPLRSVPARRIVDEYQYLDDVMNPSRAEREGRAVVDPTVDELRQRTQGIYRYLRELAEATKGERIITKESSDVSNATIWALHGGDSGVRIFRDQADLAASVRNVRTPATVGAGRTVFTMTADPAGAVGVGNVPAQVERIGRRVPMITATSFDDFLEALTSDHVEQFVLVAREQDGGLAFSDRWVSLSEIEVDVAEALEETERRPVLFVVTNGGAAVQKTFSDTSRFSRVLSLQYVTGQLDTFESALETVATLLEAINEVTVTIDKDDFDAAVGQAGPFAAALTAAAAVDGGRVRVDMARLLGDAARADRDVTDLVGVQRRLMEAAGSRSVDVDATIAGTGAAQVSKQASARKARAELSAVVQTKFE